MRKIAPPMALICLAALAAPAAPATAGEKPKANVEVNIEHDGEEMIHVQIGSSWLGAILAAADIDCDRSDDRDVRKMMDSLRAQGEGGVFEYRDRHDGDQVLARRSRGSLKLETIGSDGERASVEMPWETADCLMGGVEPEGELGKRIALGLADLKVDVRDDDSRVRVRIE
jgi:hypothetical protein